MIFKTTLASLCCQSRAFAGILLHLSWASRTEGCPLATPFSPCHIALLYLCVTSLYGLTTNGYFSHLFIYLLPVFLQLGRSSCEEEPQMSCPLLILQRQMPSVITANWVVHIQRIFVKWTLHAPGAGNSWFRHLLISIIRLKAPLWVEVTGICRVGRW